MDGGEGNEDAAVTPEVPAGLSVWQAVLNDHTHGQLDDAFGISCFRLGDIVVFGIEYRAALLAAMLRIGDADVAGPVKRMASEIMDGSLNDFMARSFSCAARARPVAEVP